MVSSFFVLAVICNLWLLPRVVANWCNVHVKIFAFLVLFLFESPLPAESSSESFGGGIEADARLRARRTSLALEYPLLCSFARRAFYPFGSRRATHAWWPNGAPSFCHQKKRSFWPTSAPPPSATQVQYHAPIFGRIVLLHVRAALLQQGFMGMAFMYFNQLHRGGGCAWEKIFVR